MLSQVWRVFLYLYPMSQTLQKKEKLKSRKIIGQLFVEGRSVVKFPIKLLYLPVESLETHQAAFAVPKRSFKSAVDRNRIKRQLRETYRLQKEQLEGENGKNFAILFLYIGKNKPKYDQLYSTMAILLKTISKWYSTCCSAFSGSSYPMVETIKILE